MLRVAGSRGKESDLVLKGARRVSSSKLLSSHPMSLVVKQAISP